MIINVPLKEAEIGGDRVDILWRFSSAPRMLKLIGEIRLLNLTFVESNDKFPLAMDEC